LTAKTLGHKGNKMSLPSKACLQCGLPMTWRKAWAKNWEAVKYCSERCRNAPRAKSTDDGGLKP
jgi:hypothetical protein